MKFIVILGWIFLSVAQAELSATATLRSSYVWNGQPLSDDAVIEGSLDYAHESGVYVGIWAASYSTLNKDPNVDVTTDRETEATNEVDYYLGYSYDISEDFNADIMINAYTFTTSEYRDYYDITLSLNYQFLTFKYSYFDEYDGVEDDGTAHVYRFETEHSFSEGVLLAAHIGYTDISNRVNIGYSSYLDYLIGVYKQVEGFKVGLEYTDTNREDYSSGTVEGQDLKDQRMSFLISKTF